MTTTNQNKPKKRPLIQLIKTTFIGGFLVVLPAYLGILALNKMIKGIVALIPALLTPLAKMLGIAENDLAIPIALIIFLLLCLIAGVIIQSSYAALFKNALEPIFKKIPGYVLVRRIINRVARMEQMDSYDVAFVALGETYQALAPAFLIQKHENGYYTIFMPAVPTPTVGNIYIIPEDRVFPVNVPLLDMVKFISHWGEASPQLLEAIQDIHNLKSSSELFPSEVETKSNIKDDNLNS